MHPGGAEISDPSAAGSAAGRPSEETRRPSAAGGAAGCPSDVRRPSAAGVTFSDESPRESEAGPDPGVETEAAEDKVEGTGCGDGAVG